VANGDCRLAIEGLAIGDWGVDCRSAIGRRAIISPALGDPTLGNPTLCNLTLGNLQSAIANV
jgi:hypothetical protein